MKIQKFELLGSPNTCLDYHKLCLVIFLPFF